MARRPRRRRLGTPKKTPPSGTPGAPSIEEWAAMTPFGSFVVTDYEGEHHPFKQGETAIILPHGEEPWEAGTLPVHKHWVAKIKEIRAYENSTDVWVRVQWYWSGEDVCNLVKSFDASACAMYERMLSDQYDLVPVSCFSDLVSVTKYDEYALEQPDIEEEEFFTRYTLEYRLKRLDPKPLSTCICTDFYNPDHHTMHFCPRPSCRRYFHSHCLTQENYIEPPSVPSDRPFRLIACSPDNDNTFLLTDLVTDDIVASPYHEGESTPCCSPILSAATLLGALPTELVEIAQQPIVKGFDVLSVVGNVNAVIAARRIVYGAMGGEPIPDDWPKTTRGTVFDASTVSALPAFMCPECWGPI